MRKIQPKDTYYTPSPIAGCYYLKADKWNLSEPTTFNSKNKKIHTWISVDSEFQTKMNTQNDVITVQLDDDIFEHPRLGSEKLQTWKTNSAISHYLGLEDKATKDYPKEEDNKLIVDLGVFFSPTDIFALFTGDGLIERLLFRIDQDKRLKSNTTKNKYKEATIFTWLVVVDKEGFERHLFIQIHDACALMGQISLRGLAIALNIPMPEKELLSEEDKREMLKTYNEKFDDFVSYAKGDSKILHKIFQAYQKLWENICDDLRIEKFMPGYTVGTNTAKITEKIIVRNLSRNQNIQEQEVVDRVSKYLKYNGKIIRDYREIVLSLNQEATSKNLAKDSEYTSQWLALIDGGRCKNERPRDTKIQGLLADIDINGCYGNGLLNQIYPVGIPTIMKVYKDQNNQEKTLEKFLDSRTYKDLVPGLWFARVSTTEPLDFDQDLLISKIPPDKIIATSSDDLDQGESQEILGTFILLTREVQHAVLNRDLLQILEQCSSNNEFGELKKKLYIETLIYYPASRECNSMDDWSQSFSNTDKGVSNWIDPKDGSSNEKDARSRHWVGVPMGKDWVDVLLGLRKNTDKKDPKNAGLKLIINSTYGVQSSSYFDVGNVVVGNNITARTRAFAWMMAKAFGMYQTITDGGIFNINAVNNWKEKKPGLNILSNINNPKSLPRTSASRITTKPLGSKEWKLIGTDKEGTTISWGDEILKGKEGNWQKVDKLAWEHLKQFFKGNEIDLLTKAGKQITGYDTKNHLVFAKDNEGLFQFGTKDIYIEASFQSQANYRIVGADGKAEVKARGYNVEKTHYLDQFGENQSTIKPMKDCLERISQNKPIPPYPHVYTPTVLKIKAWHKRRMNFLKNESSAIISAITPGDTIARRSFLRPISLSMFKWQTWQQWQAWNKKHVKLREKSGYGVEQYFLEQDGTINYQNAIDKIQDAIDDGKKWITTKRSKDAKNHPYLDPPQYLKNMDVPKENPGAIYEEQEETD